MTTNKTYRYEIAVGGRGGDFWFIRMTPEHIGFWREKGNDALTEHLNGGSGEDGTPPELALGFYHDVGEQVGGIDIDSGAELIVRDEEGKLCLDRTFPNPESDAIIKIERVIAPGAFGALFRTFEKGADTYHLELLEPFDPSKLRLHATTTPRGDLVRGLTYAGVEVLAEDFEGKEWAAVKAELLP